MKFVDTIGLRTVQRSLVSKPKGAAHGMEHRKSMVFAQNLVPLKYRRRFHDCYAPMLPSVLLILDPALNPARETV
jgi:hypothetical protein